MEQSILSAPIEIFFALTYSCNLHCLHCYLRANNHPLENELTPEEMNKVLDKLIEMKILRISLTGGEPMLRMDFFNIIKKLHQKIGVRLTTNGNFINSNNVKELTRYIKEIAISLDGATAESHDKFRGKNGSFDKAICAIHNINDTGNKDVRLEIKTTLNKYNINETDEIIDLAVSLNARAIRFWIIYPYGRALDNKYLFPSNIEVKNAIAKILQKKKTLKSTEISFDDSLQVPSKLFGCEYSETLDREKRDSGGNNCGIAHSVLSIMPNGDIFPCELFGESQKFLIGNALKDDISALWIESKVLNNIRRNGIKNPEICMECKNKTKCITVRCPAQIITNRNWCSWYESI